MKIKLNCLLIALAILSTVNSQLSTAHAQGTAFTYNGRLNDSGAPATGSYDLQFTIYNAVTNGTAFGALTNTATAITNGLFTATLDFGGVFNGSNYWLEIAARTNGGGVFSTLSPRQQITPTPYAIYSANAGSAATATTAATAGSANSISAANIAGTVQLTQLPGTILTNNETGANSLPNTTVSNAITSASATYASTARNGDGIGNIVNRFPRATLFSDGSAYYAGMWHYATNSLTCSIQEIINYYTALSTNRAQPGGVQIVFDGGIYYTHTTIALSCTNPFTLYLDFPGKTMGGIVYAGSTAQNVFTLQSPDNVPECSIYMENGFIASAVDGMTNIVDIEHPFGNVDIGNMWIGYWPAMTNNQISGTYVGLTPPTTGVPGVHANLIGINISADSSDKAYVHDCSFFEVQGVEFSPDHGTFDRNLFSFCAHDSDWPPTSKYSLNAAIYIKSQTHGDIYCHDNDFYYCANLDIGGGIYYVDNHTGTVSVETTGDTLETSSFNYLLSPNSSILVQNPHGGFGADLNGFIVTNSPGGNYGITTTNPPDGYFTVIDNLSLTPSYSSSFTYQRNLSVVNSLTAQTISSQNFIGNGVGLTNLTANAIAGGFTTNILVGGHAFYITNGVIMNVQ
jgi:hypothetical protein